MGKGKKYYVVWEGVEPGVYDTWEEAQEQVLNYPGAKYKSFTSQEEAIEAYRGNPDDELRALIGLTQKRARVVNYDAFPEIDQDAIAVDASCLGNPGVMEYRGVDVKSGAELFRQGPFEDGTNNVGEYLALVYALAYCYNNGITRTIYSDSKTAMSWVRKGVAKTTLAPTPRNARLLNQVARANTWVQNHQWQNKIIKWDTEQWGEIPADFGRK